MLYALCGVLAAAVFVLLIKIYLLRKAMDEIREGLDERLTCDTNTLLSISTGDRRAKRLAAELNRQLRELRKLRRQYQSGDRELKEAITNISHDLRTPVTAICGYLDLLEREEASEDVRRYLSFIKNRAEALKQLTEELFGYSVSVSEPGSEADVCLNGALEESVAAYYDALNERGITPEISMPETKIIRRLDSAALSRVLSNLLSNAVKYSDGDLSVSLSEAGEIVFENAASELDEVQAGKLFNRFYTVNAARNATGLGLAISHALVARMNGQMTAQYAEGRLRICVVFPNN